MVEASPGIESHFYLSVADYLEALGPILHQSYKVGMELRVHCLHVLVALVGCLLGHVRRGQGLVVLLLSPVKDRLASLNTLPASARNLYRQSALCLASPLKGFSLVNALVWLTLDSWAALAACAVPRSLSASTCVRLHALLLLLLQYLQLLLCIRTLLLQLLLHCLLLLLLRSKLLLHDRQHLGQCLFGHGYLSAYPFSQGCCYIYQAALTQVFW